MRYTLGLFVILIVFWTINSQYNAGLILFFGLISILLVLFITHRMKLIDQESTPLHLFLSIWPFWCWLLKEIVVGSIYVLKKILQGNSSLSPKIIEIKLDFKDEISKVIFANSITLVPGTLSVQLNEESIVVHALTQELADDLLSGELAHRIKRIEDQC